MAVARGAAADDPPLTRPLLPELGESGELVTPARPPSVWSRLCCLVPRPRPAPESDYEVLIHGGSQRFGSNTIRLSDPRLRPRFPVWVILALVLLFLTGILCVFFLIPRGIGIRSAEFDVQTIYVNKTVSTYKLTVKIKLPVYNANYVDAYLSGNVTMRFYKVVAGSTGIPRVRIPRRTKRQEITANVDASFIPYKYIAAVMNNCFFFPYELVFFLDGQFEGRYLGQKQNLTLDTYIFVECPKWPQDEVLGANETACIYPHKNQC